MWAAQPPWLSFWYSARFPKSLKTRREMLIPEESTRSLVSRYQRGINFFPAMPVVQKYMKVGQKFALVIFPPKPMDNIPQTELNTTKSAGWPT